MATSKTLTPTNVTIQIPEFTDQPDQRVNSNCIDKEADAINALNSQIANMIKRVSTGSAVAANGGTATIAFPTGYTNTSTVIINQYLLVSGTLYLYPSAAVETIQSDGIHVKNNGGASGVMYVDITKHLD